MEKKRNLVTNYGVHTLYSTCKRHYRYSDLGYDIFDVPAIIGDYVAQTNSEILHDLLKCQNIDAVDDLLNGYFQLSNGFGVIAVFLVFNIASQKAVTCVQIRRMCRQIEAHASGLFVPQSQNAVPKVLLQDNKHSSASMGSSSVLHEPHLVEIGVTLDNGDEIIFQKLHSPFGGHNAIKEYRTDYSVTGHCTPHSRPLRVKRLPDREMRILSAPNAPVLLIDEPIQMKVADNKKTREHCAY